MLSSFFHSPCDRKTDKRRQRRHEFFGESRKTAEFGNSNVWFPNSSIEPAAASGTGHCPVGVWGSAKRQRSLPQSARVGNADQQSARDSCGFEEFGNSNLWFPNSCSIRRQQVAVGPADRRQQVGADSACRVVYLVTSCGALSCAFAKTKHPEALIYGRRMRLAGASRGLRTRFAEAMPIEISQRISGRSQNSGTPIYGSRIRVLSGGSKWLSALPTRGSNRPSALPTSVLLGNRPGRGSRGAGPPSSCAG